MKPFHLRALSVAVFALAVCWAIPVVSGQDAKRDLTEFRTVETALTFLRVAPEWVPAVQGALILAAVMGDAVRGKG